MEEKRKKELIKENREQLLNKVIQEEKDRYMGILIENELIPRIQTYKSISIIWETIEEFSKKYGYDIKKIKDVLKNRNFKMQLDNNSKEDWER